MNNIIFIIYLTLTILIIFKNWNDKYGVVIIFYLAVGIYSVPTLYAYLYDIDIFKYQNIYLTHGSVFEYSTFLIASLVSVFYIHRLMYTLSINFRKYTIIKKRVNNIWPKIFIALYLLLFNYLTIYFIYNIDDFKWGREGNALGSNIYSMLFRYFQVLFLLYVFCIGRGEKKNLFHLMVKLVSAILILVVATKSGARSDILYISLALFFYFISKKTKGLGSINLLKLFILSLLWLIILQFIYYVRTAGFELQSYKQLFSLVTSGDSKQELIKVILLQDYLFPSATLIMSIEKQLIIPVEGFLSNILNSLYGFKEPLLHDYVTGAYGLSFERGTGIAYFLFTEGYNLFGLFGFIYNGIVWGALLFFITLQYRFQNNDFARILSSIYIYFVVFLVRAQSGVVLKIFIFQVLPILLILYCFFGYRLIRNRNYHFTSSRSI